MECFRANGKELVSACFEILDMPEGGIEQLMERIWHVVRLRHLRLDVERDRGVATFPRDPVKAVNPVFTVVKLAAELRSP